MEKADFVTYEQALALYKLGFREECYQFYDTSGIIHDNKYVCKEVFQWVSSSILCVSNNTLAQGCKLSVNKSICDAPTLAQAQKWLLKNKSYFVNYYFSIGDDPYQKDGYGYTITNICSYKSASNFIMYDTPEEALSAGIDECLKMLENDKEKQNS